MNAKLSLVCDLCVESSLYDVCSYVCHGIFLIVHSTGNEFRNAIDYINCHVDDAHKILYCALDYSHISKHRNLNGE